MKKIIAVYNVILVLIIILLGVLGVLIIRDAQKQEILTVQSISGAVLADYPQLEETIVSAALNGSKQDIEKGRDILSHYGYDSDIRLKDNYIKILRFYAVFMVMFICTAFFGECIVIYYVYKRRKKKENDLLYILDNILSENYEQAKDRYIKSGFDSTEFGTAVIKLADALQLKSEHMNMEHDNTKTLVTDISHQLKTPISALKACLFVCREADNEAEKTGFLERSIFQVNKLEGLIQALVQISRLENGMITLKKQEVSVTEILIDAVNAVYTKASDKGIDIVIDEFDDIRLLADKRWTTEVLVNVIDNAIKYSPDKSVVNIRVQELYSFVRIEIEDSGIGISREEQNRIFARFYRGENEVVKNQEGAGVGLYLARRIIEEQGGTISAYPKSDKGSVFVVQVMR